MTPLQKQVLRQLMDGCTWVGRGALDGLTTCGLALDDALADLVADGLVEFHPQGGYRVAGTALQRGALKDLLRRPGLGRAVRAEVKGRQVRMGVAERRPEAALGVVMYALALERPTEVEAQQAGADVMARMASNLIAAGA